MIVPWPAELMLYWFSIVLDKIMGGFVEGYYSDPLPDDLLSI